MVQLIAGNKGKGKTKHLLDKVNAEVKIASGNITDLFAVSFLRIMICSSCILTAF